MAKRRIITDMYEGCNVPMSYKSKFVKTRVKKGFCGEPVYMGWNMHGAGGKVCFGCWDMHTDDDIDFNLHDAYGVAKTLGGSSIFDLNKPANTEKDEQETERYTDEQKEEDLREADSVVDDLLADLGI